MRIFVSTPFQGVSVSSLIRALHDTDGWGLWLDGVRVERVLNHEETRSELRLCVDGPRQFRVDVECVRETKGIAFSLLEGPLRSLGGSIHVQRDSNSIDWKLYFSGLTAIPGVLSNEIEERVIPRWGEALVRTVNA